MRLPELLDPQARPPSLRRPAKSAEAFRTISEVADHLEVPQHVLRFWESKFPQIKPLKRAGGRRYYRPDDVALLRRIRQWLYEQGYTIRGVQKLLREGGLKHEEAVQLSTAKAAVSPPAVIVAPIRPEDPKKALAEVRAELEALRALLLKGKE